MPTSLLQDRIGKALRERFTEFEILENTRPSWLCMEDGTRLELDFFIPDLRLAFEVQGEQHYRFTERFHGTQEAFEAQKVRDEAKRWICEVYGIALYEVTTADELITCLAAIAKEYRTPWIRFELISQYAWDNRLKFISNQTRKQCRKLRDVRREMERLRSQINSLVRRRNEVPDKLKRQYNHWYKTHKEMQDRLVRSVIGASQFYEERIRPRMEAKDEELRAFGGLFEHVTSE